MAGSGTEFDTWLSDRFRHEGAFTALIVLLAIGEPEIDLLRSTFLHVIGDETGWNELAALFESAGVAWNAAAFVESRAEDGGLVPDAEARLRLSDLVARLNEDRLLLNEGLLVDRLGRRLRVEETTRH